MLVMSSHTRGGGKNMAPTPALSRSFALGLRCTSALLAFAGLSVGLGGCSTPPQTGPLVRPELGPIYQDLPTGFDGRPLYRNADTQARTWANAHQATGWLKPVLQQPQALWANGPTDLPAVERASRAAARQERRLVVVAYDILDRSCNQGQQGAAGPTRYLDFIAQLVQALDGRPAVVVLEPDAIAATCYTPDRGALLHRASESLTGAGHFVYLDAGHSDWQSSGVMAERLIQSGITHAAGFSLNVSARGATADVQAYGQELSDLVGGRPFVLDTSRNGLGPSPDRPGRSGWCNPERQGLGSRPNTKRVRDNVAQLWIKSPGESDGTGAGCGAETAYAGLFSPRQARRLIAGASWVSASQKRRLPAGRSLPRTR